MSEYYGDDMHEYKGSPRTMAELARLVREEAIRLCRDA
jgi:hypothetical protein